MIQDGHSPLPYLPCLLQKEQRGKWMMMMMMMIIRHHPSITSLLFRFSHHFRYFFPFHLPSQKPRHLQDHPPHFDTKKVSNSPWHQMHGNAMGRLPSRMSAMKRWVFNLAKDEAAEPIAQLDRADGWLGRFCCFWCLTFLVARKKMHLFYGFEIAIGSS